MDAKTKPEADQAQFMRAEVEIESMARQLSQRGRVPTEKQARWIRSIQRRGGDE